MVRLLVITSAALVAGLSEDTSCSMVICTASPSLICGVIRSLVPTSCRSMVWKGLVFVELAVEPVITGISCPTRIDASSLSKVSRLGVERIFDSESLANAETRVAKLKPSDSFPRPMAAPLTVDAAAAAASLPANRLMIPGVPLVPDAPPPKLMPPAGVLPS